MDNDVVDPADKVPVFLVINLRRGIHVQSVQEADFTEDNWVCCLKDGFSDPTEYQPILEKTVWTGCNYRASSRYRTAARLLVESKRANAAFLVALRVCLKWARCARERVHLNFTSGPPNALLRGNGFES